MIIDLYIMIQFKMFNLMIKIEFILIYFYLILIKFIDLNLIFSLLIKS